MEDWPITYGGNGRGSVLFKLYKQYMEIKTEKDKFFDWLSKERGKGLIDFRVTSNPDAPQRSEEECYAELNRMIEAPVCEPNLDLF